MTERKRYGVHSLRFKLVLASTLVEIVMLGALVWNSTRIADQALTQGFETRVQMLVPLLNASIAPALAARDYATLEELLEKIVHSESLVYVEVRDVLNRRVSGRGPVPESEIPDATLRHADATLDQAIDVKIGGDVIGRVRYGVNVSLLDITVDQLRWQGIAIAAAEVVVTFGLLALLGYLLTRHLRMLSDAARNMQEGDHTTLLPENGLDEVGDTARAFNTMARAVKQSLLTLEQNQALLRAITDHSPAVIYVKNVDGRFMFVNREFERLFELSSVQIIGKSNHELLPKNVADAVRANDVMVIEQKSALQFEELVPLQDGPHSYLSVKFPLFDESGLVYATGGISSDITQRKLTEEMLRNREQLLLTIANNFPGLVSHVDRDLRYRFASIGYERIFGWSPVAAVGKKIFEVVGSDIFKNAEPYFKRALLSEQVSFENEALLPSGEPSYSLVTLVPDIDSNGNVDGVFMFGMDISARKQAEEDIRMLNTQLERRVRERTMQLEAANEELEAFAYSVSHDLRAPLRAIDGFSQALMEDHAPLLDRDGQGYLERVRAATQRMGVLIDDLLNLSRVSRQEMKRQDVDLSALVQEIVAELTRHDPQRALDVVIALGVHSEGDARLLRIMLDNLLSNAWKYTSKHTTARIEFGVSVHSGERIYFVRDDGAGFDKKYASKLFGAFQRLHKIEDFPGTGVGLATAARVVHRHGGRIWAEAEVEKGAVFYFTLLPREPRV